DILQPSPVSPGEGEALEAQLTVELVRALPIKVLGDAVVRVWRIEEREIQPFDASARFVGARDRYVHAAGEAPARPGSRQPRTERAAFDTECGAVQRCARPRDHVDNRKERAVSIERRRWSADDLDALEQGGVDPELQADLRLSEDTVVHA